MSEPQQLLGDVLLSICHGETSQAKANSMKNEIFFLREV